MTFHTQHFDDYDQAGYWLKQRTNLTNAELEDLDENLSGEIRFKATYPGGWMTLDYTKGEEFDVHAIQEYEMPEYISPLSSLFASFNDIFGGRK
jgi:hypothetical protein